MSSKQLLESIDSGSNYNFGEKMDKPSAPRSVFDLSHLNTLTIPNAGVVVPVGVVPTLPNDDMDINVDCLVRVMPQVVPMYSRQRLYIYAFYGRLSDYWNNFNVFMTKGYSGNVVKKIPILDGDYNFEVPSSQPSVYIDPDSFFDYIGLPIGSKFDDMFNTDGNNPKSANITALINMMAFRVWRDYFANKNHFIDDRVLLPDDDSRFRLNDNGELLSAKDEGVDFKFVNGTVALDGSNQQKLFNCGYYIFETGVSPNTEKHYRFGGLFLHDYPMDYFQSALPFTQRGDTPSLDGKINLPNILPVTDIGTLSSGQKLEDFVNSNNLGDFFNNAGLTSSIVLSSANPSIHTKDYTSSDIRWVYGTKLPDDSLSYQITLNQIRELAIKQTELEKMAHTDGSYRDFGLTFFGEVSKNATDFRPIYIGGTYKNIVFTEVLQTSGSSVGTTDPSNTSPLGAYAGHGITGITNGRIGHIHCDDYGYIMFFACIMPDVYYSQGIDKHFTTSLQSEMFLPERAKLGMVPILNKELYYAGNNGNDIGDDNYLWAYQNPFDEFRYIPNHIHGKIADTTNKSFFPYTQSRKFTQLPNWGEDFAHASDVRKDSFFAPSEDAYSAQFSFNIRAVRPLPYKAIPAKII